MSARSEKAMELHRGGYNCCQAVACAFADVVNMSEEDLFCITEGFGLGMGGMRGTCGAVSGAVAIMSLVNSKGSGDLQNKRDTYKYTRMIVEKFEEKNTSSICHELKGVETKKVLRACPGCVQDAAEILEECLKEREAKKAL